jgi:hypothetical protein
VRLAKGFLAPAIPLSFCRGWRPAGFWVGLGPKLIESSSKGAVLYIAKETLTDAGEAAGLDPLLKGAIAGGGAGACQVPHPARTPIDAAASGRPPQESPIGSIAVVRACPPSAASPSRGEPCTRCVPHVASDTSCTGGTWVIRSTSADVASRCW